MHDSRDASRHSPRPDAAAIHVRALGSAAAVRESAAGLDDVWVRSPASSPTARAHHVAHWLDTFAAGRSRTLVVEQGGRPVAILPLRPLRRGPLSIGGATHEHRAACGELLLDPDADPDLTADALVGALRRFGWPVVWLRGVRLAAPGWQAIIDAAARAGVRVHAQVTHEVGRVELPSDWEGYLASLSGNHRRHMRKAERRAATEGTTTLEILDQLDPGEVERWMRRGLEVEHRSWKGRRGSSVLADPTLFAFYLEQARRLAADGELRLAFLEHDGTPIAFEYGMEARGVYYTPKVGYDEAYARLTPSQLLRHRLFEQLASRATPPVVDFTGPLVDATSKWTTSTYPVGTLILVLRPVIGLPMLGGYRALRWWRARRRR